MEFTELNLWNKITEFVKRDTFINKNLDNEALLNTELQINQLDGNNYQLIVNPIKGFPNAWILILVKFVLMKYYPELNVHIFSPRTTIRFGASPTTIKTTHSEYDIFDTKKKRIPDPMFIIKNIIIMDVDEDIIRYVVPKLSEIQINDLLNSCDATGSWEAKTLILRYINQQESLTLEL